MVEPVVLQKSDIEKVMAYEKERLLHTVSDEVEREMASWHASWRLESLEHYLPLGWSFGLIDSESQKLVGYFIAQPQLFLRGMTQTLWVERLVASSAQLMADLVDLSYRICREKHFQKALFFANHDVPELKSIIQLNQVSDSLYEIKTAKF